MAPEENGAAVQLQSDFESAVIRSPKKRVTPPRNEESFQLRSLQVFCRQGG